MVGRGNNLGGGVSTAYFDTKVERDEIVVLLNKKKFREYTNTFYDVEDKNLGFWELYFNYVDKEFFMWRKGNILDPYANDLVSGNYETIQDFPFDQIRSSYNKLQAATRARGLLETFGIESKTLENICQRHENILSDYILSSDALKALKNEY